MSTKTIRAVNPTNPNPNPGNLPPAPSPLPEIEAALRTLIAVGNAIRDLKSIPSGHLYARLCGVMSLDTYTVIIRQLKDAGLVSERNHVLTWIGPTDPNEADSDLPDPADIELCDASADEYPTVSDDIADWI